MSVEVLGGSGTRGRIKQVGSAGKRYMGDKVERYRVLLRTLDSLCRGETDRITIMSTIACELFHTFDCFDWVGFYRNVGGETLKVGPYQGEHGCLTIPFSDGVCGKCARELAVQNVPDVTKIPYHIACSSDTRSEIAVPIVSPGRPDELVAVLDIDSNLPAAFDSVDEDSLIKINRYFS